MAAGHILRFVQLRHRLEQRFGAILPSSLKTGRTMGYGTTHGLATQQAIPLLWTESWSGGDQSLPLSRLHPLFVEVCRRVRLETRDGHLYARTAGSKRTRVAASHLKGALGDPWTPVELSDPPKSLSITSEGFSIGA